MATGNIATEQTVISLPGQRTEQGRYFISSDQSGIGSGGFRCYGIATGSKKVNFGYRANLEGEALHQFFKDSNLSSIGTPLAVLNTNANSSLAAETTFGFVPTVVLNGTLWDSYLTTPGVPYYSGEITGARSEAFILEPNTQYMICFSDLSIATNLIGIRFGFFEFD